MHGGPEEALPLQGSDGGEDRSAGEAEIGEAGDEGLGRRRLPEADEDRPLLQAFMRGVGRTGHLDFGHPGLAAVATRAQGALVIQSDVGPGDAYLLVTRVTGLECEVTHANPHLRTVRFFQRLLSL